MDKKIKATAKVQVTIQVNSSAWGEDCPIGQLYRQAAEDAINQVVNLRHYRSGECGQPVIIVGEPKVIGIITERE